MDKSSGGTRISSRSNLLYGTVESRFKIPSGSNIVSSFILMADNGDEIDFEFVGKDSDLIQTNYFYQGKKVFDVNAKMYKVKDLSLSYNTFTINWTKDFYEWKFNGVTLRKLLKNETKEYPETISKVQFGIWNATKSNWAGDNVNWSLSPFNYYIDYISINCKTVTFTNTSSTLTYVSTSTTSIPTTSTTSTSTTSTSTNTPVAKSSGVNIKISMSWLYIMIFLV